MTQTSEAAGLAWEGAVTVKVLPTGMAELMEMTAVEPFPAVMETMLLLGEISQEIFLLGTLLGVRVAVRVSLSPPGDMVAVCWLRRSSLTEAAETWTLQVADCPDEGEVAVISASPTDLAVRTPEPDTSTIVGRELDQVRAWSASRG